MKRTNQPARCGHRPHQSALCGEVSLALTPGEQRRQRSMALKCRALVFILTAFAILAPAPHAFAQEAEELSDEWYLGRPIRDVIFDGLKHVRLSEMEGITEPYIGKKFTHELFDELNGQIWALDYFEPNIETNAVPLAGEVIIRYIVTERPVISKIVFEGNKGLRRNELLNIVSIKANEIANQAKIRIDEQALTNKYLEKGYPDINIRSQTEADKDGSLTLTFLISEGDRVAVTAINFEGNTVFSQKTLASQLTLKTKGSLEGIVNAGAFQEAKLIADRDAILRYYHDRGYINAEITDIIRDVTHTPTGNNLALTFRISEGEKYTFGGITFIGNKIFTTAQLEKLVQSKKGEVINQSRLEMDFMRIMTMYTQGGYIFNSIGREEHRDDRERVISYTIPIVERGRAHIENIIVRGNKKTRDYVILRELPVETGDIFSNTKLQAGYTNLYNLQYFSNVVMDPRPGSAEGLMDLYINVEEQHTTDLQAGVTFSGSSDPDSFPISLLFKWTDKNFMGTGNILGAEVNLSPDIQSLSMQYTHRWIFGLPLSGGFDFTVQHSKRLAAMDSEAPFFNGDEDYAYPDGFWSFDDYNDAGKLPPDAYLMNYDQWALSLGFSTGYRFFTPLGNLGVGGSIRTGAKFNDFENDLFRPFDQALRDRNGEWTPSNSIAFNVSLDKRDVFYDPSRGYYLSERFAIFGLLPNKTEVEYYNRNDIKAEWFITLWNWQAFEKWAFKGVFGIHTGLSFILAQPGNEVPIIEDANKLSIDGMFIGRGWTGERLNRGLALWENWAELRIPLVEHIIALDGFFDAAVRRPKPADMFKEASSEGINFIDDMRFSYGFGLRFALPQFPFRFLFAKRFRYEHGNFTWIPGTIGGDPKNPAAGMDFVVSFAISTY